MAKKSSKGYFGLNWIVSVILAIIPVTSFLLGFLTRLNEKKYVAAVIRLLVGWNLWWFLDLICMIFTGKICRILNC
ncbi:MAG: hypothetical protein SO116_06210 [Treponema sp.]|nr:hypothetical protein [Treponema sp.]